MATITLCATLAGSDTWADIELLGKARIEWLRTFLRLENGKPSHDTCGRIFCVLSVTHIVHRFVNADDLPRSAWKRLIRPPRYVRKGAPRRRPERVKQEVVEAR